jgi:hypothetical protein
MTLNITGPMEIIEIPTSAAFEAMLKKLDLPPPRYKGSNIGGGYFQIEVIFYPSAYFLLNNLPPHSIMGCPASSLEETKEYAARDAIEYMATDQRKVLKDYNYDELEQQRKLNKHLQSKLEEKTSS